MRSNYHFLVLLLLVLFVGVFALSLNITPEGYSLSRSIPRDQASIRLAGTATPSPTSTRSPADGNFVTTNVAETEVVSEQKPVAEATKNPNLFLEEKFPLGPQSRGYMTTPAELVIIAEKADKNIQPYKDAVESLLDFVNSPDYWPYETISGKQKCSKPLRPEFIGEGAALVYGKAMAYHLTGNSAYAKSVRALILDLVDTEGYGGEVYSGANQCILNLSWYIPNWIMAADLIEGYEGWSKSDKLQFQTWLADEVYKKTAWASRQRKNNWGSAGSAASGMIADYISDTSLLLQGSTAHDAYIEHKMNQLDRLNTKKRFDSDCPIWGIQPDGGIPDELVRGSSGCFGKWLVKEDASYTYMMTFLQGAVMHAEFLLRRGDRSLYDNIADDGSGYILNAIHFVIANSENPGKSRNWRESSKPTLEVTYRYYRDEPTARQLRIGKSDRFMGGKSNPMIHFGTLTHGFATYEDPGLPPTAPPP